MSEDLDPVRHLLGTTVKPGKQPGLYNKDRFGQEHPRLSEHAYHVDSSDAPPPGTESVGPTMFDLVRDLTRAEAVNNVLMEQASRLLKTRTIVERTQGTTDGSGVADFPIYQVPNGYEVVVTRLNIDAVGFTPASPYTNAAGFLALYSGQKFSINGGQIVDFLPNPPVASGAILPASITNGVDQAGIFRGGEVISLRIQGGPVTIPVWVRLQGIQRVI